ncbi:MAG: hypothetical protein EZS28_016285 [Streblomastix strix]|uniref:Uncharacterized protein n=1 Tax=Streblomastix strix TaxID=222440 RepID=A0A5J4W0P5_9EUKA|nr:MAG: hypothetical protein EZS28_016285 [Streblomastix strix]
MKLKLKPKNASTNPAVEKFVDDVQIRTNIFVLNQLERLVIDVRWNQGGYDELASRILRYLTGILVVQQDELQPLDLKIRDSELIPSNLHPNYRINVSESINPQH